MMIAENKAGGSSYLFSTVSQYPVRSLLVGFGVASIHFVITAMIYSPNTSASLEDVFSLLFTTPSLIFSLLLYFLPVIPDVIDTATSETVLKFFTILFSSASYGIVGGLLVSESRNMRQIAITILSLFILCWFFLVVAAGQASA